MTKQRIGVIDFVWKSLFINRIDAGKPQPYNVTIQHRAELYPTLKLSKMKKTVLFNAGPRAEIHGTFMPVVTETKSGKRFSGCDATLRAHYFHCPDRPSTIDFSSTLVVPLSHGETVNVKWVLPDVSDGVLRVFELQLDGKINLHVEEVDAKTFH